MTQPINAVAGPEHVTHGFVHDFLEGSNALESTVTYGDRVKLDVECEGYSAAPVVLRRVLVETQSAEGDTDSPMPFDLSEFETTVVLRPHEGTDSHPLATTEITVLGLTDKNNNTLTFTLAPDHPLREFISFDQTTGAIRLEVTMTTERENERPPDGIYHDFGDLYDLKPLNSSFLQDVWDKHQQSPVSEGVLQDDAAVPEHLALSLRSQLEKLAAAEPVDWHPGSNNCVRDLVHPSLFPFVRGESTVIDNGKQTLEKINAYISTMQDGPDRWGCPWPEGQSAADRWGRCFEASKYQWLPTVFRTTDDGKVTIEGYINNLKREKYPELYDVLARLFEVFLPQFEMVHAYLRAVKTPDEFASDDGLMYIERKYEPDFNAAKLRNMGLRVITKIVDYELRTDQDFVDGVFHVEGMSTDHIIMTGIYVVSKDEDFAGGSLEFKRSFLDFEGSHIFENINQTRHLRVEELVDECYRPLGTLHTPEGRLIVFPNSHIHRLSKMTRDMSKKTTAGDKAVSRRRVVVFWVVDPERDVMTTAEVPEQQGVMSLDAAKGHRLTLMEERKKHKGKLNRDRKISLCEH